MNFTQLPHVESVSRKTGVVGIATLGSFLVRESLKRFVVQGTQKVRKLINDSKSQKET